MSTKNAAALLCLVALWSCAAEAEDWPTYRHDNRRSGVTAEQPAMPLSEQWTFIPRHAPRPAWPEPLARPSRVRFDTAYHVAVAGDLLYFGSSADNKVYALDAKTGEERWAFLTGGPIRIAPAVSAGQVYAASDDGRAYCLDAADGREVWTRRAAPGSEKVLGNGRMISLWPMRAGVVVADGVAYFCAGIFPAEGIFLHAARAKDGTPLWTNDSSGQMYLLQPHPTAEGFTGVSPQGPMLASAKRLYVPTGRSVPAAFDRSDGRLLFWHCVTTKDGGAYALLADELLINTPGGRLIAYDRDTGDKFAHFPGLRMIVTRDTAYLMNPGSIVAAHRTGYTKENRKATEIHDQIRAMWRTGHDLSRKLKGLETAQTKLKRNGKDLDAAKQAELAKVRADYDAFAKQRKTLYDERTKASGEARACTKWTARCSASHAMILAGTVLFAGGDDRVIALDAATGKEIWTGAVSGQAHGLAFSGGRLFVSTDQGTIHCFSDGPAAARQVRRQTVPAPYPDDEPTSRCAAAAERIVGDTGVKRGFCLVLNCGTGRLIHELAKRTDLQIYGIDPSPEKVAAARRALDAAGLYGPRAMVDCGSVGDVPYPNYFADLIVNDGPVAAGDEKKALRMLKPCGGVLLLGTSNGKTVRMVRGPLEGTADWTHQYADAGNTNCSEDRRLECPLTVLWFGEPGPAQMINRHCHGPAPLCVHGRMFVCANNVVMAYDAHNGLRLWERQLPGSRHDLVCQDHSNIVAARDSVYVAAGGRCFRLNAATGATMAQWPVPDATDGVERLWGYLAYEDDLLFGSASPAFAGRRITEDPMRALARAKVPYDVSERLNAVHGRRLTTQDELRRAVADILTDAEMKQYEKQLFDTPGLPHGGVLSDYLFALDRKTGAHRWTYRVPKGYVFHNAIAVGGGRVFAAETDAETKRVSVVALNAQTGKVLWRVVPKNAGQGASSMMLVHRDGVLVLQAGRLTALSAGDGKVLWQRTDRGRARLAVGRKTIVAEPHAYDLRTGEQIMRVHPVTGHDVPWRFSRAYGCGSISSSANCLFFRSASIGYYDMKSDFGTTGFGGTRPGCWVNVIGAAGLMLAPESSAGCTCSYSTKTTLVLQPATETRAWSVFSSPGAMQPVKRLAINFGAPGDRKDADGTLWLGYPRPCQRFGLKLDLKEQILPGLGCYRRNAATARVSDEDRPWIFASGCCGLSRCTIPLNGDGKGGVYTVRLAFAEPGGANPGQRVFDVKLQGDTVLSDFDIAKEAGGPRKAVVKEFANVKANGSLAVELVPKTANPSRARAPLIAGLEIVRTGPERQDRAN